MDVAAGADVWADSEAADKALPADARAMQMVPILFKVNVSVWGGFSHVTS